MDKRRGFWTLEERRRLVLIQRVANDRKTTGDRNRQPTFEENYVWKKRGLDGGGPSLHEEEDPDGGAD